jgi:hypothetical protein
MSDVQKYKILSAVSVVDLLVSFESAGEPRQVKVSVDYANGRVFFHPDQCSIGESLSELEEAILEYIRPPVLEPPALPQDALQRIAEVRAGNYGAETRAYGGMR